ncbi:MAG: DUF3108 domain-containing protein [Bacteroidaceae bacterium]|nr:DUF3108 domain-containing protein [Bacteroidaceae bacterium]
MKRIMLFAACLAAAAGMRAAGPKLTDGEQFRYGLYIGPVRAGDAVLSTKSVTYNGEKAYSMQLIGHTTKAADKIYSLHDTLTSILDSDGTPLEYRKYAHEGDRNVSEKSVFTRSSDGKYVTKLRKVYTDGHVRENQETGTSQVYDLISIMTMTRNMDTRNLYVGKRIDIQIVDGADILHDCFVYNGRETLKVNGEKVQCLVFNVVEPKIEKGKTRDSDVLTIFVSDDDRRTIVQLEINLGFGAVKAKLQ